MRQRKTFVSPVGEAKYCHLTKPNTKFDDDGVYSVDLRLNKAEESTQEFLAFLTRSAEAAREQYQGQDPKNAAKIAKYTLFVPVEDETDDDGNETGNVIVRFKNKALIRPKGKDPFEKKPLIVDAKKRPIEGKNIGRGSKMKVAFQVSPFCMSATKNVGVTLWLEAVQILELVEYGSGAAGVFEEEEGYEFDPSEAPSEAADTTEDTDDAAAF